MSALKKKVKKHQKLVTKVVECKVSYTQFTGEDLFDVIEKFSNWIQWEPNSLIMDLPDLGAAYELWELITVVYDVNSTTSAIELIEAGELTIKEWNDFVVKYGLREKGWKLYKQVNGLISTL